ncbi:MAG: ATP-binding protein [Anaerolineae bacterium]|nr:ATP-binding protein [Anaerolineae bacterium]
MPESAEKFAALLTEGVHRIRINEGKTIQVVQDELGYAVGRKGGAIIEHWRKGHLPPKLADVEKLATEIVRRGRLERDWLEQFLRSAGHPAPAEFCNHLFPLSPPTQAQSVGPSAKPGPPPVTSLSPFVVGPPITHPHHFFGREYELKCIFDLWKNFPLQNVAVIGPKRSGKTSLLHYLKEINTTAAGLRLHQRADWLPQPERYHWVFVDFRDARMGRRDSLLRYMLASLEIPSPEMCDLERFMDGVSQHLVTPTIILMDDISAALSSPELDQGFWNSLRSLGSNYTRGNLAFLLTAPEPPAHLAQGQGKPSPFFNIFGHTFTLGPLEEEEARELIASSPLPFDEGAVEWILAQSGRWPCLLQILCHSRLTALQHGQAEGAWQQESLQQIAPFRYLLA